MHVAEQQEARPHGCMPGQCSSSSCVSRWFCLSLFRSGGPNSLAQGKGRYRHPTARHGTAIGCGSGLHSPEHPLLSTLRGLSCLYLGGGSGATVADASNPCSYQHRGCVLPSGGAVWAPSHIVFSLACCRNWRHLHCTPALRRRG